MFRIFGKKTIDAKVAVRHFIEFIVKQSENGFHAWVQLLTPRLVNARLNAKEMNEILDSSAIKICFFSSLCALEAMAVKNLFDAKDSSNIYNLIHQELSIAFSDTLPAKLTFDYLAEMDKRLANMQTLPQDAAAIYTLFLIGLSKDERTAPILRDTLLIPMLGLALLSSSSGWWKDYQTEKRLSY